MPGISNLMSDSASNHKLTDFVARYWHYGHILEMCEKRFTTDYCKWAKKQGYRSYERLASEILAVGQSCYKYGYLGFSVRVMPVIQPQRLSSVVKLEANSRRTWNMECHVFAAKPVMVASAILPIAHR